MNILVLSPHPDDESIGCGGTIRKHVRDGDAVEVVFLTSGEKGGPAGMEKKELICVRELEAGRAKEILGIHQVEFWRQPDGNLTVTNEVIQRLVSKIKTARPQLVFVTHGNEHHPDHRAAAELTRRALASLAGKAARPRVFMYEVWTPLWRMDHIVDISDFVEIKRNAIRAHESQCAILKFDEAILALNRFRGEMYGWPGGDYAEVFEKMIL
jgi:LmbE family N-acetylglucosaminyl deacetylase